MSKVTSKYQVTLPRAIADQYHIRPGDDIEWVAAGDVIRVIPPSKRPVVDDREMRLRLFDQTSQWIKRRSKGRKSKAARSRGWRREDLYTRGRTG